jgi:hypothetical protein
LVDRNPAFAGAEVCAGELSPPLAAVAAVVVAASAVQG